MRNSAFLSLSIILGVFQCQERRISIRVTQDENCEIAGAAVGRLTRQVAQMAMILGFQDSNL